MRLSLSAVAALSMVVTGCFSTAQYTEVNVRDPTALTVSADTPHGRDVVLPPGPANVEAPIPMSAPPYVGPSRLPILARREESGATVLRCDACTWQEGTVIADGTRQIVLGGGAERSLRWNGDRLVWNVDQVLVRQIVAGSASYVRADHVAQVVVSTPKANVVSAEHVSRSTDVGTGVAEIIIALPLIIAGSYVAATAGGPQSGKQATGGTLLAVAGIVLGGSGITMVLPERRRPVE
jgi:hypothetical protein